jgi:DNA-binding NtrC family response regulator
MTAHSTVDPAEVMRLGAFRFVEKPFDLNHMASMVAKALETGGSRPETPTRH